MKDGQLLLSSRASAASALALALLAGFVASVGMLLAFGVAFAAALVLGRLPLPVISDWFRGLTNNALIDTAGPNLYAAAAIFFLGGILWSMLYGLVFEPRLKGRSWERGVKFALIPWLFSLVIFMPLVGGGLLGMGLGAGPLPVLGNLILHAVWGAILGVVYGSAESVFDRPLHKAHTVRSRRGARHDCWAGFGCGRRSTRRAGGAARAVEPDGDGGGGRPDRRCLWWLCRLAVHADLKAAYQRKFFHTQSNKATQSPARLRLGTRTIFACASTAKRPGWNGSRRIRTSFALCLWASRGGPCDAAVPEPELRPRTPSASQQGTQRATWRVSRNSTKIWPNRSPQSGKGGLRTRNPFLCQALRRAWRACGSFPRCWNLLATVRRGSRFPVRGEADQGPSLRALPAKDGAGVQKRMERPYCAAHRKLS